MEAFDNDPRNPVYTVERIPCPECDGEGKILMSCCGDNIRGTINEDILICPTCHEHLGDDKEECTWCDGTGYVEPK